LLIQWLFVFIHCCYSLLTLICYSFIPHSFCCHLLLTIVIRYIYCDTFTFSVLVLFTFYIRCKFRLCWHWYPILFDHIYLLFSTDVDDDPSFLLHSIQSYGPIHWFIHWYIFCWSFIHFTFILHWYSLLFWYIVRCICWFVHCCCCIRPVVVDPHWYSLSRYWPISSFCYSFICTFIPLRWRLLFDLGDCSHSTFWWLILSIHSCCWFLFHSMMFSFIRYSWLFINDGIDIQYYVVLFVIQSLCIVIDLHSLLFIHSHWPQSLLILEEASLLFDIDTSLMTIYCIDLFIYSDHWLFLSLERLTDHWPLMTPFWPYIVVVIHWPHSLNHCILTTGIVMIPMLLLTSLVHCYIWCLTFIWYYDRYCWNLILTSTLLTIPIHCYRCRYSFSHSTFLRYICLMFIAHWWRPNDLLHSVDTHSLDSVFGIHCGISFDTFDHYVVTLLMIHWYSVTFLRCDLVTWRCAYLFYLHSYDLHFVIYILIHLFIRWHSLLHSFDDLMTIGRHSSLLIPDRYSIDTFHSFWCWLTFLPDSRFRYIDGLLLFIQWWLDYLMIFDPLTIVIIQYTLMIQRYYSLRYSVLLLLTLLMTDIVDHCYLVMTIFTFDDIVFIYSHFIVVTYWHILMIILLFLFWCLHLFHCWMLTDDYISFHLFLHLLLLLVFMLFYIIVTLIHFDTLFLHCSFCYPGNFTYIRWHSLLLTFLTFSYIPLFIWPSFDAILHFDSLFIVHLLLLMMCTDLIHCSFIHSHPYSSWWYIYRFRCYIRCRFVISVFIDEIPSLMTLSMTFVVDWCHCCPCICWLDNSFDTSFCWPHTFWCCYIVRFITLLMLFSIRYVHCLFDTLTVVIHCYWFIYCYCHWLHSIDLLYHWLMIHSSIIVDSFVDTFHWFGDTLYTFCCYIHLICWFRYIIDTFGIWWCYGISVCLRRDCLFIIGNLWPLAIAIASQWPACQCIQLSLMCCCYSLLY